MMSYADITLKQDIIYLSGVLNFNNVMQIYAQSLLYLKKLNNLEFDFSNLQASNSAGLALTVEWIKYARREKKPICFHNLTANMLVIAKVAGIDQLLNFQCVKET